MALRNYELCGLENIRWLLRDGSNSNLSCMVLVYIGEHIKKLPTFVVYIVCVVDATEMVAKHWRSTSYELGLQWSY